MRIWIGRNELLRVPDGRGLRKKKMRAPLSVRETGEREREEGSGDRVVAVRARGRAARPAGPLGER